MAQIYPAGVLPPLRLQWCPYQAARERHHRWAATLRSKNPPFDFAVVDEAQHINPSQLKFLAALGATRPNALFFAGDLRQRIFQEAFSWRAVGVDVGERSHTLQINYRTSHHIRRQADRLLPFEVTDADGITEERTGTISLFNGPVPDIRIFDNPEEEIKAVAKWLTDLSGMESSHMR